ncbi:hypothetical protein ACP275_01G030100 [Erythranthe tilingii]
MSILTLTTQLDNRTDHRFDFEVDEGYNCPLKSLAPGGTQSIDLARIIKCCRERGSHDWMIRVMIGNDFTGMYLHPKYHLLCCTKIVFDYERKPQLGFDVLVMRGSREKGVDCFLRLKGIDRIVPRNVIWNGRPFVVIALANPRWNKNLREIEDPHNIVAPLVLRDENITNIPLSCREIEDVPNIVAPLVLREENITNIPPLRQGASSQRRNVHRSSSAAATSPPEQERVRRRSRRRVAVAAVKTTNTTNYRAAAAERNQKKVPSYYHAPSAAHRRQFDGFIYVLLFVVSFSFFVYLRFFLRR